MSPDRAVAGVVGYEGGNEAIEIDAATLKKLESAFLSVGAEDQALITEVLEGSKQPLVICILAKDEGPSSTAEVYLKLSLLSL